MIYMQSLHRDSTINDAVAKALKTAARMGTVVHMNAEVQRNLFSPQEDVFVTLEVETK